MALAAPAPLRAHVLQLHPRPRPRPLGSKPLGAGRTLSFLACGVQGLRLTRMARRAEAYPPAAIVGGGRLGEAFAQMGLGEDVIVRRGEAIPDTEGPIYVCTRNDALESVIAAVPESRQEDLVFMQNGVLMPFLEAKLRRLSI